MKLHTSNLGWSIVYTEGSRVIIFPKEQLNVSFTEDRCCHSKQCRPDEMPHYVAFYLGLHCLPKCSFRGSGLKMAKRV